MLKNIFVKLFDKVFYPCLDITTIVLGKTIIERGNLTKMKKGVRNAITVIFMLAGFITVLNQTILFTAFPQISADLHVSSATVQWLTTGYMLVNGILIPITAFLIDKFTTRQLTFAALGFFTIGTIVAMIAPDFSILLIARLVQALGAGIIMPLMQVVFFEIYPVNQRGTIMGLNGLIVAFAPAIGPSISGLILNHFSWRYIFLLVLPIAITVILLSIFLMRNISKVDKNAKTDWNSILLSVFGFGFLLYGVGSLSSGQLLPWIFVILGALGTFWFVHHQLHMKKPMLEFRVFNSKVFTLSVIAGTLSYIILMGPQTILPLYFQQVRNLSALQSGLIMLPGAIANGISSLITGRLYDQIGVKKLGLGGFALIIISMIPFMLLGNHVSIALLVVAFAVAQAGVSAIMMPMMTAGINALDSSLINHGTVMTNTVRQVAGSIGTAVIVTVNAQVTGMFMAMHNSMAPTMGYRAVFVLMFILGFVGLIVSANIKEKNR